MSDLKILKHDRRYAGKVFNLLVDEVEYPSGNRAIREVAEHPGGAVVVPLLQGRKVILVRQFRYPIQKFIYELPAGKLDPKEDPQACAARELEEETGYVAGRLEKLTAIYTSPGFCTEQLHIFLGTELKKSRKGQNLEEGERTLTFETVTLSKAVKMVENGAKVLYELSGR